MMCTTVLHAGVCNRTSTPHKSGNKVKEKKKIRVYSRGVTIRYPHDTIRIAILESRYDTYRDTW